MDQPVLNIGTSAAVEVAPTLGMDGGIIQSVMIKERFGLTSGALRRVGGAKIEFADVPWEDAPPERGSTKVPADLCLFKPGTDVLFCGSVIVPAGLSAPHLDALIRVGPAEQPLRVFGPRVWERTATRDLVPSAPVGPVQSTELRWENAFGGYDATVDGEPAAEEPLNPIGRGVAQDLSSLVGTPAHSIEDPREPFRSHRRPPPPVGVAPIGRHWEPRRSYAGTYDAEWQAERMPLLPFDFDVRHNQCAPKALVIDGHLKGGEAVDLLNVTSGGGLSFTLPRLRFFVGGFIDGSLKAQPTHLDTVFINANDNVVDLTWRAQIPTPRPQHRLRYIQVNEQRVLS